MTIVHEPAVAAVPDLPTTTFRRRRSIAVLTTLVAAAGVAALGTSAVWAWAALGLSIGLCAAYAGAWHRSQRRDIERRFETLVAGNEDFFAEMSHLAVSSEGGTRLVAPARRSNQTVALARFAVSYAAGWALAPLVFLLTVAVGKTPRDTTGQRWLVNLQRTQAHLRDQSMRTLAVTATATASVTAVGGATLLSGGASAYAAPGPAASASVGSPASVSVGVAAVTTTTTYTVASGDTLSSIAARFGTTWSALAASNHLSNPNLIFPGQVLRVGQATATAPAHAATGSTYTVQSGDTLSAIAARFGTSWQALAQANGLANPNFITVGEVLRVGGSAPAVTTSAGASSPVSAPAPTPAPAPAASSAQVAVNTVLAQVGKPYEWAGAGPGSFDCSGLVMYAWAAAGVQLAHYTVSQYEQTTRISQSQLQPGDLVFYDTGGGAQPGHVTMYIGGGRIVTADSPGTVVRVEDLYWDGTPMGFGRVRR